VKYCRTPREKKLLTFLLASKPSKGVSGLPIKIGGACEARSNFIPRAKSIFGGKQDKLQFLMLLQSAKSSRRWQTDDAKSGGGQIHFEEKGRNVTQSAYKKNPLLPPLRSFEFCLFYHQGVVKARYGASTQS
jgi:hypothetical protein